MEDLKKIQEFFSKPLNEGKQLDIEDFAKVVKAVEQTGHPVTVLLVPKFNEIEVITGMNAPDDMLFDLSNAVDALGYGRNDIIIAGDSSNLSRREYSDIRRVNGGAKDYFEESVNEAKTYKKGDKLKIKLKNGKEFDVVFDSYSSNKGIAYGKIDGDRKPFSLDAVVSESVNEVKRPEPNYKELVKLLIMAFKHEPKSRFYFNRNNGVVYFDLIGGAAYSPKKSKMRDIFGGMNPIAVNREFGRADHHEEETIKQVEQLSKGKIKAEIKELGDGVLYKLKNEPVKENSRFEKRLAKMAADEKEKRAKSPSYAASSKLDVDVEDFIEKGQSYGEFKKRLDKLKEATKEEETEFHTKLDKLVHDTFGKRKGEMEEHNTGIYYNPAKDSMRPKAKEASKTALEKVKDMIQKIMKEELSDYEEKEADYDKLYSDYLYKMVKEVATEKGYSKFLVSKDNPKGETSGLDTKTMNKILMNVIKDIDETIQLGKNLKEGKLCKAGEAYRKRRMAAGEKSSAYLSGRAVKVCKGQMSGKKKK